MLITNPNRVFLVPKEKATDIPAPETIKLLYCNVNGIAKKSIVNMDAMLNNKMVDIFGVCEHKKLSKHDIPQFGGV